MASIIVCVDDERVVLESLRSSLVAEFRGVYTIESASDGQEAMELIEELSDDGEDVVMLVTDWLMPKLKGDELITKTQEIYPEMRKIMITGQADQNAIEKVKGLGGLDHLFFKPWDSGELFLKIRELLKK